MLFILSNYQEIIGVANNDSPKGLSYFDDNLHESIQTGVVTYEFSVPAKHPKAGILFPNHHVVVRDLDANLLLFTIKEVDEYHQDGRLIKRVFCENTAVSELLGTVIPPSKDYVSVTLKDALQKLMANTLEWEVADMDSLPPINESKTLEFKDYTNMLDALHLLASTFGVELYFTVSLNNFRVISKKIHIVKKRGTNRGMRFEYTRNLTNVRRKYDSTGVVTGLYGVSKKNYYYSKDKQIDLSMHRAVDTYDIYKPEGASWVGSKVALSRWGSAKGQHVFGIYTSETADTPERLFEETVEELRRRCNPYVTYEASIQTLERVTGHSNKVVRVGDTVTIINKEFTPDIVVSARIIEMNRSMTGPTVGSVKLGEFRPIPKNLSQKLNQLQDFVLGYQDKITDSVTGEDLPVITEEISTSVSSNVKNDINTEFIIPIQSEVSGILNKVNEVDQKVEDINTQVVDIDGIMKQVEEEMKDTVEGLSQTNRDLEAEKQRETEMQTALTEKDKQLEDKTNELVSSTNSIKEKADALEVTAGQLGTELGTVKQTVTNTNAENKTKFEKIDRDISATTTKVTGLESTVTTGLNGVNAKVSSLEKNVDGKVGTAEYVQKMSEIDVTIDGISQTVSSTSSTVSGHESRIKSAETSIKANEDAIKLKASSKDVYTKGETDAKVKTVLDKTAALEVSVDGIRGTVEETTQKVDGMAIGGRQLLKGTSDSDKKFDFKSWQYVAESITPYGIKEFSKGGQFTMSADITSHTVGSTKVGLMMHLNKKAGGYNQYTVEAHALPPLKTGRIVSTVSVKAEEYVSGFLYIRHYSTDDPQSVGTYARAKFERGNKVTDWTPAPEDTDGAISSLSNKVTTVEQTASSISATVSQLEQDIDGEITEMKTQITANANGLTSRVTNTKFNEVTGGLDGRVKSAETFIQQNENTITTLAKQDGVISMLNQTPAGFTIAGHLIDIAGKVTFSTFDEETQQKINAIDNNAKSAQDSANYVQGELSSVSNMALNTKDLTDGWTKDKTFIDGGKIYTGTVTASQLNVNEIFGNSAVIGKIQSYSISADRITAGTIKGIKYESINQWNPDIKLVLQHNSLQTYGEVKDGLQDYTELKEGKLYMYRYTQGTTPTGSEVKSELSPQYLWIWNKIYWTELNSVGLSFNNMANGESGSLEADFDPGTGQYSMNFINNFREHVMSIPIHGNSQWIHMRKDLWLDNKSVQADGYAFNWAGKAPIPRAGTIWYGQGYGGWGWYAHHSHGWLLWQDDLGTTN